jgi:hypothetical protein
MVPIPLIGHWNRLLVYCIPNAMNDGIWYTVYHEWWHLVYCIPQPVVSGILYTTDLGILYTSRLCGAAPRGAVQHRAGRLGKEEKACFFALQQRKKHAFLPLGTLAPQEKACFFV